MLQPYLCKSSKAVWKCLVKIRCSNHKLSLGKDRYNGIDRNLQHCDLCNMNTLGDEYHTFLECSNPEIVNLRRRFIPYEYRSNRSMYNFVKFMKQVDDVTIYVRISSFIKHAKII